MKTTETTDKDGKHLGWLVFCVACGCCHHFDDRWYFDGNLARPSFYHYQGPDGEGVGVGSLVIRDENGKVLCHSSVHGGIMKYCSDSTHHLRNQTVTIPEMEEVAK